MWYFTIPTPEQGESSRLISIEGDQLRAHVETLTQIQPARNYENVESLNSVASYIEEYFEKYCPHVEIQSFEPTTAPGAGNTYANVICSFNVGSDNARERIVIGAHYDVDGDQPGADDNASGVAGLLELARLLSGEVPQEKVGYRIDLVAYTLEEVPYFRTEWMGSAVHARSLQEQDVPVALMISLEMIGYFSDESDSQLYPVAHMNKLYPDQGNFISIAGVPSQRGVVKKIKDSMVKNSDIPVESILAPRTLPGIDFSDHLNYWDLGYSAIMITDTSFYRNKHYHKETDTSETLDFDRMRHVVHGVYWAVKEF